MANWREMTSKFSNFSATFWEYVTLQKLCQTQDTCRRIYTTYNIYTLYIPVYILNRLTYLKIVWVTLLHYNAHLCVRVQHTHFVCVCILTYTHMYMCVYMSIHICSRRCRKQFILYSIEYLYTIHTCNMHTCNHCVCVLQKEVSSSKQCHHLYRTETSHLSLYRERERKRYRCLMNICTYIIYACIQEGVKRAMHLYRRDLLAHPLQRERQANGRRQSSEPCIWTALRPAASLHAQGERQRTA